MFFVEIGGNMKRPTVGPLVPLWHYVRHKQHNPCFEKQFHISLKI